MPVPGHSPVTLTLLWHVAGITDQAKSNIRIKKIFSGDQKNVSFRVSFWVSFRVSFRISFRVSFRVSCRIS